MLMCRRFPTTTAGAITTYDEDYNLTFTPLGNQKAIRPCVPIHSMDELVAQVRQTMAAKTTPKQTANPLKTEYHE